MKQNRNAASASLEARNRASPNSKEKSKGMKQQLNNPELARTILRAHKKWQERHEQCFKRVKTGERESSQFTKSPVPNSSKITKPSRH